MESQGEAKENKKVHLSNYWFNRAEGLHKGAIHLYEKAGDHIELTHPCLLLAGLSIEVIAKAILVKKEKHFDEKKYANGHSLEKILTKIDVTFTDDQLATLAIMEDAVVWLGKYPAAKGNKQSRADDLFKRSKIAKIGHILSPNYDRWPNQLNYLAIWRTLIDLYFTTPTENPSEFGYKLKGHY